MAQPDWTFLASQPESLPALSRKARSQAAVSAIRQGSTRTVVSRVKDSKWHLFMYFEQSNVPANKKELNFDRVPPQFVDSLKDATYRWWLYGVPHKGRPSASTLVAGFQRVRHFLRWLDKARVKRLGDVTRLHISSYVEELRKRKLAKPTLQTYLQEVERLYEFRMHCSDGLLVEPWPGSSAALMAGFVSNGRDDHLEMARTLVIPDEVLGTVFQYCEKTVAGYAGKKARPPNLELRDAIFFLLGITSGMRSEELLGIRVGCIRTDTVDGVSYTWLQSVEHKLRSGPGEWMVPPDAVKWVKALERWGAPLRSRIAALLTELEKKSIEGMDDEERLQHSKKLHALRASKDRLFLGESRRLGIPSTLTNGAANDALKRVAIAAGVDWALEAHQMRRTMAVLCARHELGDLLYLKKQLKHRSLDMTALYAMNPAQDESLFNEIFDAHQEVKADLLEHWLDPGTRLAGGAAEDMTERKISTLKSRKELATNIASKVSIRATGHGWCLAQDDGCGGRGLYEKTRCVDCSAGLIDDRYKPIWQGIFEQQVELLDDALSLGAGARRRIKIDVDKSARVLNALGVAIKIPEEIV